MLVKWVSARSYQYHTCAGEHTGACMATATDSRPNAPARAPASSSAKSRPNKTGSQGKFQFVNFDGLQNYLKLRTKLPITDQLSAEVGADYNVTRKDAAPQAALFYEVCGRGCQCLLAQLLTAGTENRPPAWAGPARG